METTEKIGESYCRYIKHWFTLPNIRCEGQYEIDLLAVDTTSPEKPGRYHIECGVSISGSYSKLTAKPFSIERLRTVGSTGWPAPHYRVLYRAQVPADPGAGGAEARLRVGPRDWAAGKLSADHCHMGHYGGR